MDRPEDPLGVSAPRFLVELVAWVATPWALWSHSVVLAIASVVVLIGVPTVFGTEGSKKQATPVGVPGVVGIGLEVGQAAVALVSSWFAWGAVAFAVVVLLVAWAGVAQRSRWRWMLGRWPGVRSPGRR